MIRWARNAGVSPDDAEDIVQDVCIEIYHRKEAFLALDEAGRAGLLKTRVQYRVRDKWRYDTQEKRDVSKTQSLSDQAVGEPLDDGSTPAARSPRRKSRRCCWRSFPRTNAPSVYFISGKATLRRQSPRCWGSRQSRLGTGSSKGCGGSNPA